MKMKEPKIAVYSGTRSLYPYMGTAIKSMLANSSAEKVYLLIEDDVFPEWMPEMVETIKKPAWGEFKKNLTLTEDGDVVDMATGEKLDFVKTEETEGSFDVKVV